MVPKPLQNRSWRGSGGHLGATLEARCFQDLTFDDFGSILGPPLGPVWAHFGHHFFDVFLKCLFEGFGLHLGSQNTSKMRPKRVPRPEHKNHRFWWHLHTLATFRGPENDNFSMFFWNPVLGWFLEPILMILACAHFGHHFFDAFLRWLFDGLGLLLGSQNTSKMRPKRGSKSKPENHRFCCYLQYMSHISGCWKSYFLLLFLNPILGWLLEPILVILAHF